jgi:hypothetical protein
MNAHNQKIPQYEHVKTREDDRARLGATHEKNM